MGRGITLIAIAVLALLTGIPVRAQDRPTVFVHGLRGDPGSWQPAADRLRGALEISPYVPALPWGDHFETQAGDLQRQLGSLPTNALAIGHSNGGIVSRQWSLQHPLGGIVTAGSPLKGAPIVNTALSVLGFHESLYNSASAALGALGAQPNEWWSVYVYVEAALALARNVSYLSYLRLSGLGLLQRYPVLPQMAQGSTFLNGLNSSPNLAREASAVPARVGLVFELDRYWQLGPLRLVNPREADEWYPRLWAAVSILEFAGNYLLANYPANPTASMIAIRFFQVSGGLRSIDPVWCWAVTGDGTCSTPHDGIVPVWSQAYPGGVSIGIRGPSHLQETQVSDAVLTHVLTNYMQVEQRGGGGGGDDGGGGGGGGGGAVPDELQPGESLWPGDSRTSQNGEFSLYYQGDGNLVLYRNSDGAALWYTSTPGPAGEAAMQGDGNFVVYSAAGQAQWWSGTAGYPGARLAVQSDSNLVIYDRYGTPLWWRR